MTFDYLFISLVLGLIGLVLLAKGTRKRPKRIKVYHTLTYLLLMLGPFLVIYLVFWIYSLIVYGKFEGPAFFLIALFTGMIVVNRLVLGRLILFSVDVTKVYAALDVALKRRGLEYRLERGGITTVDPEMRITISNQPVWKYLGIGIDAMGHEITMAGVLAEFRRALNGPLPPPASVWSRRIQIVGTGLVALAIAFLAAAFFPP